MRIVPKFLNGNDWWQNYVRQNCETGSATLSDPTFLAWIGAQPQFYFTTDTPAQIRDKLTNAGDVEICVRFHWNPFTREIAEEQDGCVSFNTAKCKRGAGGVENCVHETMHAMGWSHDGNQPAGNEDTVPWKVGREAGLWPTQKPGLVIESALAHGIAADEEHA